MPRTGLFSGISYSAASIMKIDHLEVVNLLYEYPSERRFRYAGGTCTGRVTSLVLVHTDSGHAGIGSAYSHPGLASLIIKGQLEAPLRGRDPREVEELWRSMYNLTRWYGRKGAAMSAIGALDMAFWDLRGKALGKPVWKILGGERLFCTAYASALLWKDEVSQLADEAGTLLARGFRRMKMRMARGEEYDTAAVRAVRRAIGKDNDLMVDASMRYNLALARRVGKVLEENGVFWYEEPFTPEDIDSYAALCGTVRVPIAAGENEFGVQGFRELIRAKAVDIVQPDASRCGGISEVIAVARMAADSGLSFAPHTWSDAVAVIANAHVVASQPNGITVEIDQTGNPFIDELLVEPLRVRDGLLALSDRPGLGVELNQSVLDRFRMADPLTMPDGFYSDMAFGKDAFAASPPYVETP
jgi:L-alanine-DL-glutamate epimerase-like enolase superfamily enzyme